MKHKVIFTTALIVSLLSGVVLAEKNHAEYKDWRLLSISHRTDKHTLRAILGNDTAINAARENKTKPWPDGTILAKVKWKEATHPNWNAAIIAGEFEMAEAMIKDSKKYPNTAGWGFARWENGKLEPYNQEKSQECFACHTAVQSSDYVFTMSVLQ